MAEIPCANPNCDQLVPAHPWAAYCSLACLIEVEWAEGKEVRTPPPDPA